jgi:3-hydroxybutyryl-CoA dehydrogenase
MRSIGFRMGPFELIDLIGCDVNLAVTQSVYDAYFQEPKYRPHPIQKRMVESGRLGQKTGHGFYDYDK